MSNTGQTSSVFVYSPGDDYSVAQKFTTGGGAVGFYLGSIDLDLWRSPGDGTLTVTVRDENASGEPGSVKYTLTNPSDLGTGIERFEAPYGAYLSDESNYYVHLEFSGSGTEPGFRTTESTDDDSGARSGWSIGNDLQHTPFGEWSVSEHILKIRVNAFNVTPPPPDAPSNLRVVGPDDGQISVAWDNPEDISIRKYQYSTDGGTIFNDMNGSNKDTTSFTFENLNNAVEYHLAIRAVNLTDDGEPQGVHAVPMAAPADLIAAGDNGRVVLRWTDPGYSAYPLVPTYEYSTDGGTVFTAFPDSRATTTRYAVTGLTNGTEYSFVVRGALGVFHSQLSNAATATPAVVPPSPPADFRAAPGDAQVVLSWDDPSDITIEEYQLLEHLESKLVPPFDDENKFEFGYS
ncbi:MAG: fibronectin type III domain-containing protein, partial [Dehalococcoidia bacterium]|nr:fibronectin type III domain-containing protein [Dehalococcoidia bacterium]